MKNNISSGNTLDFRAPSGGVVSGKGYWIGNIFIISNVTAAQGELCSGDVTGVKELAAATHASTQAWAFGDKIYWDDTAKVATITSTSNKLIGVAAHADGKASPDAVGWVRLTPLGAGTIA